MNDFLIAYRAWVKSEKRMYEVLSIKWDGDVIEAVRVYRKGIGKWVNGSNVILMQASDSKDSNGSRIFEGDIVERESFGGRIYKVYGSSIMM